MAPAGRPTEDVSRVLFEAWRRGPSAEQAAVLLRGLPVPGSVAVRGRYHLLTDDAAFLLPPEQFDVERDTWDRQVELTAAADTALVAHDVDGATAALAELRATHRAGRHPLPLVDALVGSADAARQADRFDDAATLLDEALDVADRCRYRFGTVRALVAGGYLTLLAGSARQAAARFADAAQLARELDERVYLANALTGEGEALARLRDADGAGTALRRALALFEALGSDVGIVNAAQHLGDLYRRERRLPEAVPLLSRALEVSQRSGHVIGEVNASDGLGEVHLGLGDLDAAARHYEHAWKVSSADGYLRGQAHALNGLGRLAAAAREWDAARSLHEAALERYRRLEDMLSATNALDGMAAAATALGEGDRVIGARLDAVRAVEAVRAAQDRHDDQQEYLDRFAAVYTAGLRDAVAYDAAAAFVAMFEGLAGRRLAGLVDLLPGAPVADAQLLSQLLARARDRPFDGRDLDEAAADRRARLVGRLALRHRLPDDVRRALADVGAALYRPFDPAAAAPLLDAATSRSNVVLVAPLPGTGGELVALVAERGGTVTLHRWRPPDATLVLVAELATGGLPVDARPADVAPLADVLPGERIDALDDGPLLVVPLGDLWAVPWPAVPTGTARCLGARHALTVAPTLTLADHTARLPAGLVRRVAAWRSPLIRHHRLHAFTDDARVELEPLPHGTSAIDAVTAATHDLVVVAGHGRPVPELGHYLELDADVLLTPSDLLTARTPPLLALIACWGAHAPGAAPGDPLTLATVAAARGSRQVLATTSELADDPPASTFLNRVLHRVPDVGAPVALRDATRLLLADPALAEGRLSRWAPLVTVGAV